MMLTCGREFASSLELHQHHRTGVHRQGTRTVEPYQWVKKPRHINGMRRYCGYVQYIKYCICARASAVT